MGDGHHRGGHVDYRQQGGLLALDVQIVGGEPGVGKAVIGELHRAGGGAADAIEARLRLVEAAERRRFSSAARITASGVRNSCATMPINCRWWKLASRSICSSRAALLLLQLAVFSTHPQDGNDQHRNDVDDQRVLPEGIDRHMERIIPWIDNCTSTAAAT